MSSVDPWNYFDVDKNYTEALISRLEQGVEMDSAIGLARSINTRFGGDLSVLDFGSGPGHYYPVLKKIYENGALTYRGIDIVEQLVEAGRSHFVSNAAVHFDIGSVLEPAGSWRGENCIISANTLPHVPTIEPILTFLSDTKAVQFFAFRMLVGSECVEVRKHLSMNDFSNMFRSNYQHNNIYSEEYVRHFIGPDWELDFGDDDFSVERLRAHTASMQMTDKFYENRVSHERAGMIFKGEVYMPWKFVTGRRRA